MFLLCVFMMPALRWRQTLRRSDAPTKLRRQREKWKTRATTLSARLSFSPSRLPVFILSPPFSLLRGPFFPPSHLSACHFSVSHLSFDMEMSHQPQPKARWLVPKIYLLKVAQFLIKCSRWADKRWVLWREKQQLKATEAASTVLQIPEFNKGTETMSFLMAYVKMCDSSTNQGGCWLS